MKTTDKAHSEVGRALEAAGNAVLGVADPVAAPAAAGYQTVTAIAPTAGLTLAERLRELAGLHKEGILSDEEFAAGKAKLLAGL